MASILIMEVRGKELRPCSTIGFKFHANYGNDVRRQYMEILAELAESNTLSSVASDIAGRTITVKKISTRLPELIRESEYSIC